MKSKETKNIYDNIELSFRGNFEESVTTESQVYSITLCHDNNETLGKSNLIERARDIRKDEKIVCTSSKEEELGRNGLTRKGGNKSREGFSRKLFAVSPVGAGQTPRVKVRKKDVVAYMVTSDVKVQEQRIRQTYVYPARYSLVCNIAIEDAEIAQAGTELLDEKYQDGLEAILRREDLISRQLLVRGATSFNDLVLFTTFTPAVLETMKIQVDRWATPATTLVIAYDIWNDIIADADFVRWSNIRPRNTATC